MALDRTLQLYRNATPYSSKTSAEAQIPTIAQNLPDGMPFVVYYNTTENDVLKPHTIFGVVRNKKANYITLGDEGCEAKNVSVETVADPSDNTIKLTGTNVQDCLQNLLEIILEDESVTAAAIKAITEVIGSVSKNDEGKIAYTPISSDSVLKNANSLSDADRLIIKRFREVISDDNVISCGTF